MSDEKSVAWIKFAELNPAQWKYYEGHCECITCCEYRKQFEAWYEQAKEVTK